MRLIDADALMKELSNSIIDDRGGDLLDREIANNEAVVDAMLIVNNAPTIDAVEVVRCADCKSWEKDFLKGYPNDYRMVNTKHGCNIQGDFTEPDFFCFYGERITE